MGVNQLKHPESLRTFFTTEMWERYGFYVVQTLLAIYLAMHLGWLDKRVYALVGSFTALTYISPVIGGWIADHLIGQKRAVLAGTFILFISYLAISVVTSDASLCVSLSGIAVGSGLLKPNISSLLGNEYPANSPNRESGFTIFYMGLTIGIIFGTTLPSYFSEHFGWSTAFTSAAVGMILATISFSHGIYFYKIKDTTDYIFNIKKTISAVVFTLLIWISSYFILTFPSLADTLFLLVVLMSIAYFILCIKSESKKQSKKTIVIGLLCLISIMFWAFYFQMFLSLTLFIVRAVKPTLLGFQFPPPYYVGIQSVGMIVLGILMSRTKKRLTKPEQAIRTGNKFLTSMCCMTIAYGLIAAICYYDLSTGLISPVLLIPTYLIISLAELLLSPVGLSAVTLLASRHKVSTMLGIFFVSLGIGGYLSGKLATLTSLPIESTTIAELKLHYAHSFGLLLIILSLSTFVCMLLNLLIKKLMKNT
ncbi:MAG: oligopeptide:H+ symporter [Legionellaceae bacterium]|nr:oligopeptide:H+ symporter [Legionellaceae bacterium]